MLQTAHSEVVPRSHLGHDASSSAERTLHGPRHSVRSWLLAWPGCVALAFVNGGLRDALYLQRLGDLHAHQLATGILITAVGGYTTLIDRRHPLTSRRVALGVGGAWAACTVLFEFGLGRLRGLPPARVLADYDLSAGRVWILVPLTMVIAPVLVERRRRHRSGFD